ncbi:unnamed protein product [Acanthoscelides obtectus]|uniref:DH domain-containing protein n=1 Tax=Acanthoscelides obtectus TaxID=200917 RepID=A0A9P0KZ12_ACAOB|nr:unnamed protein product [Acanthoscelides obtectus]CAK1647495.1 Myosin-M heavy chain [Acanthoscelides obtectus]
MAAVVSHAMRRFPTSPPDTSYSSCRFRGDFSSSSGSCSPAAAAAAAGSSSALSRSMRYADPWLYGGLSGGGGGGGGLLLTPAFVLCSCADYLNGTKRAKKNAPHQCRKCGGTRLPLTALDPSAKFGTVRCYPTAPVHSSIAIPPRAGTVRASPSYHARPTILPDPYDLMRRSRLEGQSTQHRSRSISPKKSKSNKSSKSEPYNTVGRRSILECDINPYELVSADDGPKAKESSSIKFVNGQRIRVRPSLCDLEYEDVQVKSPLPPQQPKAKEKRTENLHSLPKKSSSPKTTSSSPKISENKDLDFTSRFKSILKKPSTNYSDTESDNYGERSLSPPAQKGGSQFYLPLPTVRKKVQFLMENIRSRKDSEDSLDKLENGCNSGAEEEEATECSNTKEPFVENEVHHAQTDETPQSEPKRACNLNRSFSDRASNRESSVVFHDTMALRQKKRADCRIDFSDLERLDGIKSITRKVSTSDQKPNGSPPSPPMIKEEAKDEVKQGEDTEPKSLDPERGPTRKLSNLIDSETKKVIESLKEELKPLLHEVGRTTPPHQQNTQKMSMDIEPRRKISDHVYEDLPDEKTALDKLERCLKEVQLENNFLYENIPPQAPPRKRSNGKQSSPPPGEEPVKVSTSATIHTVRIDSPNNLLSDYMNRTVVQVNSPPAVHKIQIKNEFSDTSNIHSVSILENPQRKTSILINGDDCYSTVNVSDDIPLYQSSVVVNDTITACPPAISTKKSSTVYITGSFVPTPENPPKQTEDPASTKEYVPMTCCQIEGSQKKEEDPPSSDVLKELLKDPVAAVKRNLVPHVCGKADVSRRPRDRKMFNHMVQSLVGEVPEEKAMEESFLRLRSYESVGDDVSSEHSSSTQYELMDPGSDCYTDNSNRSSVNEDELSNRTKFYELLAEPAEIEVADSDDHHYESIKTNNDPIYEEIEIPPPLPSNPPPSSLLDDLNLDKEFTTRSIFEGASKYDILSYLVDAKERGIVQEQEDNYTYAIPVEEENKEAYNRVSQMSTVSDSSEDNSLVISGALIDDKAICQKSAEVERNDSGVGSETSKSSLSKYRTKQEVSVLCEDCEITLEIKVENEPLLCRKCGKKRSERKEIITEIVETEEKYGRDLQIILEEFYQPMLVAGLLTPEQLSAIFLNVEELLENSQALAERLRDAVEIALEQGDDDLLTVNMGKLFLEATPMLHAFETYCIRQGAASLLLASLEKEKELLRIFLRYVICLFHAIFLSHNPFRKLDRTKNKLSFWPSDIRLRCGFKFAILQIIK